MSKDSKNESDISMTKEELEKNILQLSPVYVDPIKGVEVFIFTGYKFPNLVKEVARLREVTFRYAGSGSGKTYDMDDYDFKEPVYRQIIVYDKNNKQIIAGCRCFAPIFASKKFHHDPNTVPSSKLFNMSERYLNDYLPYTLDVGRTFVIPEFQAGIAPSSIRSPLEYVWKGFGYLLAHHDIRYFFGRVVIYEKANSHILNLLYKYLEVHFADFDLVHPFESPPHQEVEHPFSKENPFLEDLNLLVKLAKQEGKVISPLIRAYVKLSPTIKFFGSALDSDLGDIEEMAVLITVKDIYTYKFKRFRYKK